MSAPSLASARRSRWALSFADLLLLLLGFFIMLQASGQRRDAMLAQVREQFGGAVQPQGADLRAADLFLPGEAVLTDAGARRLRAVADRFAIGQERLEISSRGTDAARQRFDAWDLSAARLGAVARALKAEGIGGERLTIRGLDQLDGVGGKGQLIHIAPAPVKR